MMTIMIRVTQAAAGPGRVTDSDTVTVSHCCVLPWWEGANEAQTNLR
jgi:hypothetical protein